MRPDVAVHRLTIHDTTGYGECPIIVARLSAAEAFSSLHAAICLRIEHNINGGSSLSFVHAFIVCHMPPALFVSAHRAQR